MNFLILFYQDWDADVDLRDGIFFSWLVDLKCAEFSFPEEEGFTIRRSRLDLVANFGRSFRVEDGQLEGFVLGRQLYVGWTEEVLLLLNRDYFHAQSHLLII